MEELVAYKTVARKICPWYPLPRQRKSRRLKALRVHMMECSVCSDPLTDLCHAGVKLMLAADVALGLRKK